MNKAGIVAEEYIRENKMEKVIGEMVNSLMHSNREMHPLVFMIKYITGLLSEDLKIQNGINVTGPYPTKYIRKSKQVCLPKESWEVNHQIETNNPKPEQPEKEKPVFPKESWEIHKENEPEQEALPKYEIKQEETQQLNNENDPVLEPAFNPNNTNNSENDEFNYPEKDNQKINNTSTIPANSTERRNFVENLFRKPDIFQHVQNAPERNSSNIEEIGNHLKTFSSDSLIRAAVLFRWISENIKYDLESYLSGRSVDVTPEGTFKSGMSVCSGYSRTFARLGSILELEIHNISGYAKGLGYNPGQKCNDTNHEWNAIKLYDKWYLLDSTWGTGHAQLNKFNKEFRPFYFLTPPEHLVDTHHPEEEWQLLEKEKIVSLESFTDAKMVGYNNLYSGCWKEGIELISHDDPLILTDSQSLAIKLRFEDKSSKLLTSLSKDGIKNENMSQYRYDSDTDSYDIDVLFPCSGDFKLDIFSRNDKTEGQNYTLVLSYQIKNTLQITSGEIGFPKCYNSSICRLYEPTNLYLPKGSDVLFKMQIKGADQVGIIAKGNNWKYLENKGDNLFEGVVNIDIDEVNVVAKLNQGGSFTSIYSYKSS